MEMETEISHRELVNRAFLYLKYNIGCSVAFKERQTSVSEEPDAIGFKYGFSYLIECKTSKADFLADKKKLFRHFPAQGMGYERYFMAPIGLLKSEEMPKGWGLLEVCERIRKNRKVIKSKKAKPFFNRSLENEVTYLVSAIRRIEISMCVFVESDPAANNNH